MLLSIPVGAQFNVDSLEHLLGRASDPRERIRLMRKICTADDAEIMERYGHLLVRYTDSLLAQGPKDDRDLLIAKGKGFWAIGRAFAFRAITDSTIHWWEKALPLWEAAKDEKMMALGRSQLSQKLLSAGEVRRAIALLNSALPYHKAADDSASIIDDHMFLGRAYDMLGDYPQSLDHYHAALLLAEHRPNMEDRAWLYSSIGLLFYAQDRLDTALTWFERANAAYARSTAPASAGITWNNVALIHQRHGEFGKALSCCDHGLAVSTDNGNGRGVLLGTKGAIHLDMGHADSALHFSHMAVNVLDATAAPQTRVIVRNQLAKALCASGRYREALVHAEMGRAIIDSVDIDIDTREENAYMLSDIHARIGPAEKAYAYLKEYVTLNDSIHNEVIGRKLRALDLRQQELADSLRSSVESKRVALKHQEELSAEQGRKRLYLFGGIIVLVVSGGLWNRLQYTRRAKKEVEKERDRSDSLLLNILPAEIAEELKSTGGAVARDIDQVTILFTDFKGFTQLSEQLSAQELVSEINTCFKAFDGMLARFGVEKIKTIGDAYMAAGGLPTPSTDSARNTVMVALEMQRFMHAYKAQRDAEGKPSFEMRVGIHTGPVVAGIVGVKKFQYDVWGDTVNTASRLESSGEVGQVNVSEATYALLKDDPSFNFTSRGKIVAKGKGELEMFFVHQSGPGAADVAIFEQ
ncbi:MAG: tetratricopeptide repeat protein [Flavobacteriales bacterium]|nr:tetratricopeptide repeat protein [Flavobacteriales bacterium]